MHYSDVRSGEDVRRGSAMVLNLASDHRIRAVASRQDLLELVEDDQCASAVLVVEPMFSAWNRLRVLGGAREYPYRSMVMAR
jgi:hypothetical protein